MRKAIEVGFDKVATSDFRGSWANPGEKELIKANKNAELEFPESEWGRISSEARDLVSRMLETDPKERITAKEALEHTWIVQREQDQKHNMKNNDQVVIAAGTHPQDGVCAIM